MTVAADASATPNAPASVARATPAALVARNVTKTYAGRPILRSVSLEVLPGETLVIFGPNGAGKTTLVRILATLARPTSGSIAIAGHDLATAGPAIRRAIGVLSHQTYLHDDLTATENLRFYGRLYDVPDLERRIDEVLAQVGLARRRDDRVRIFSRGMQQRLSLARAILHKPALLLLDEPESGLDPVAAANLRTLLANVEQPDRAIVLTSHALELGLDLADRVAILANGRVVFEERRANLDRAALEAHYAAAIAGDGR